MTGTALNSSALDRNFTVNALASSKKTADNSQNFGDVFQMTAQKTGQTQEVNNKTNYENKNNGTQKKIKDTKPASESDKLSGDDKVELDNTTAEEKVSEVDKDPAGTEVLGEEPVDEMTVEEIADALSQIIEQIKEILGITDEELMVGMESAGLQTFDLLDPANMTQLVTAIAGEDSTINLIANEELYTALQDIVELVDTQVGTLLEDAGLTSEELDIILQKLQELENQNTEPEVLMTEEPDIQLISSENADQPAMENLGKESAEKNPVIINEDDTQTQKTQELPENQQENSTESTTKVQPETPEQDAGKESDNEPKNFGQNQNFIQNQNSETVNAANETTESYTSESTENIMRQIADMIKIVKGEKLTEMELQLHPASLGTVNVSLTTKGGMVTAEFTTQSETVKAAIEAQASQLKANLEEQGVKIEAIEVSVASHQMEKNLDGNHQGQQQSEQEQKTNRIQGIRRNSINLNAFEDEEEMTEEMQGADDATRIAMEMMAANGNTMDLFV